MLGEGIHNLQPLSNSLAKTGKASLELSRFCRESKRGQCHRRYETQSRQQSVQTVRVEDLHAGHYLGHGEVCLFTALLGLAMTLWAVCQINKETWRSGHPGVRDYMLRYMAEVFVGHSLAQPWGTWAAWLRSV